MSEVIRLSLGTVSFHFNQNEEEKLHLVSIALANIDSPKPETGFYEASREYNREAAFKKKGFRASVYKNLFISPFEDRKQKKNRYIAEDLRKYLLDLKGENPNLQTVEIWGLDVDRGKRLIEERLGGCEELIAFLNTHGISKISFHEIRDFVNDAVAQGMERKDIPQYQHYPVRHAFYIACHNSTLVKWAENNGAQIDVERSNMNAWLASPEAERKPHVATGVPVRDTSSQLPPAPK